MVELAGEVQSNNRMAGLQLFWPTEILENELVRFCSANMIIGEAVLFQYQKSNPKGSVVHPGIDGRAQILKRTIVKMIGLCKGNEQKNTRVGAGAQKKVQ